MVEKGLAEVLEVVVYQSYLFLLGEVGIQVYVASEDDDENVPALQGGGEGPNGVSHH